MPDGFDITCIGHSGFLVQTAGFNLIFDFFTDKKGVITPDILKNGKTCVFVSHSHDDHFNKAIFDWADKGDVCYVLDSGCTAPDNVNAVFVNNGDTASLFDARIQITAFGSTDEGVSFLVTIGDSSLFHAGDLNCWYWEDESTQEELQADEQAYLDVLDKLKGRKIDLAFIPEDPRLGRHSGRGIMHFERIIKPARIIPMHFPGNDGLTY